MENMGLMSNYNEVIPNNAEDIINKAKSIVPILKENSEKIENNRRLTQNIIDLLRNTGVFRAAMPKEWGGPELTSI